MYRFILFISVTFLALNVSAQTNPSRKVKKAFEARYPQAEVIKWTSEWEMKGKSKKAKFWKVLFKNEGVLSSADYDSKGNWLQTKTKIETGELPEAVRKSIEDNYSRYKIVIAARFKNPKNEGYEVFLDNGNEGFNVQFSEAGEVLSRIITSKGYQPIDDNGNPVKK